MRRALSHRLLVSAAILTTLTPVGVARAAPFGAITGRVINESTGRAQSGVTVNLVGASADGSVRVTKEATTGDDGRYAFRRLATGENVFYALDARFDGGLFSGRPIAIPDNTDEAPVITSKLRVWETTDDPSVIAITRDFLFGLPARGDLAVIETVRIVNTDDRAYIGRGGEDGISLGFALPADTRNDGLAIRDATMDIPEIAPTSYGFGTTAAIPPGELRVTFSYQVAGTGGAVDLSRPVLYPTDELAMFLPRPYEIESERLESTGSVTVGGRRYLRYAATAELAAGDALQVRAVAKAEGSLGMIPVAIALLLAGGLAYSFIHLRSTSLRARARATPPSRERLLEEIAELDIRYGNGEVDEAEWSSRRAQLKSKVVAMSRQAP